MVAAKFDLVADRIIEQGSYWSITLAYPGNITGSFLKGEIKQNLTDKALTTFDFNLTYDSEIDKTLIRISLGSGKTAKLPIPTPDKLLLYDIKLQLLNKEPIRLLQGKADVSPAVTT